MVGCKTRKTKTPFRSDSGEAFLVNAVGNPDRLQQAAKVFRRLVDISGRIRRINAAEPFKQDARTRFGGF